MKFFNDPERLAKNAGEELLGDDLKEAQEVVKSVKKLVLKDPPEHGWELVDKD